MTYDDKLLEILARLPVGRWEGEAFRHMFADFPPDRENTAGARWNPPEVPAIYLSLSREVALAEAEYRIRSQPVSPKAKRTIYRIRVRLSSAVEVPPGLLRQLGVTDLAGIDHAACQAVGGAIERMGHDGLIIPSARATGQNLVIYPNRISEDYEFRTVDDETIDPGRSW